MIPAWVGPLYWTSGLGDTAAFIPAGGGTVRGADYRLPGCAPPGGAQSIDGAWPKPLPGRSRVFHTPAIWLKIIPVRLP